MRLTIDEVCRFGNCSTSSRNFVEGERLLNAGHVMNCGKTEGNAAHNLIAFCIQTSGVKEKPHTIKGKIDERGKVLAMMCSCTAGLSEKCKHSVGVLLYLTRNDLNELTIFSCTDMKCLWSEPHAKVTDQYRPAPLQEHGCYSGDFGTTSAVHIPDDLAQSIKKDLTFFVNRKSGLTKHAFRRHQPVVGPNNNIVLNDNINEIKAIMDNQTSECMQDLSRVPLSPLRECCNTVIGRLGGDILSICIETQNSFAARKRERQFRITGSRCYNIFTYCSNKKPDWEQKAYKYFYSKSFSNKYVKHGLENEPHALKAYEQSQGLKIVERGLVVSKHNAWLGYSPDGVIFENDKPSKLIEVKCPFDGKTMTAGDLIKKQLWISIRQNGNITLKNKHVYYGQVQLGMAILNVKTTDFVIYSPFDNSIAIINVEFDADFVKKMLLSLKKAYCNMIHCVCKEKKLGSSGKDT